MMRAVGWAFAIVGLAALVLLSLMLWGDASFVDPQFSVPKGIAFRCRWWFWPALIAAGAAFGLGVLVLAIQRPPTTTAR